MRERSGGDPRPTSRGTATQNNDGKRRFRLMAPRADTKGTRITTEDMARARRLRQEVRRVNAKHNTGTPRWAMRIARLIESNHRLSADLPARASRGFVVDSGATLTLLKKSSWLKKISNRLNAVVRTATGARSTTQGHGPLKIITADRDGRLTKLQDIGQGHVLEDIAFPLLSVSQMNDHGCSVVFKPKDAYMVTPSGTQIPFERENGLFFLPTAKGHKAGDAAREAFAADRVPRDVEKRVLAPSAGRTTQQ